MSLAIPTKLTDIALFSVVILFIFVEDAPQLGHFTVLGNVSSLIPQRLFASGIAFSNRSTTYSSADIFFDFALYILALITLKIVNPIPHNAGIANIFTSVDPSSNLVIIKNKMAVTIAEIIAYFIHISLLNSLSYIIYLWGDIMALWHEGNFFMNFKNHIVKWYRTVLLPVFHIDNSGNQQMFHTEGEEPKTKEESDLEKVAEAQAKISSSGKTVVMPAQKKKGPVVTGDAAAILDRINSDREDKHLSEVEKARKEADEARRKAEEEARLASIMNANKVDVDSFIAQGKNAAQEAEAEAKAAEEMRRAQEIMDRLNREAAEDEAKKQAEIEEAKKQAMKQAELDAAMAEAAEKFGN